MVGKRGTSRTYRCPPDHKHETTGTCFNQHGCGCFPCVEARRVYQATKYRKIAHGTWNPTRQVVDATGVRRRLQALAFMGWSSVDVATVVRTRDTFVRHLQSADTCTVEVRDRVVAAYSRLWDKTPPRGRNRYTANLARRKGWVGPLHWDDIDDPNETPTNAPDAPTVSVLDELDHLRAQGESPSQAVRAVGRNPGALEQMARRKNRPDLAAWVAAA